MVPFVIDREKGKVAKDVMGAGRCCFDIGIWVAAGAPREQNRNNPLSIINGMKWTEHMGKRIVEKDFKLGKTSCFVQVILDFRWLNEESKGF